MMTDGSIFYFMPGLFVCSYTYALPGAMLT